MSTIPYPVTVNWNIPKVSPRTPPKTISPTLQQNLQQSRYFPIFDLPKIQLHRFAKEKAAAMAKYDKEMYADLVDDADCPLSDNIKASGAQFSSLCDNELFLTVSNIPKSLIPRTYNSITQPLSASIPVHTAGTFSPAAQHSIKSAFVAFTGMSKGNATSPHLFENMCKEMDCQKAEDATV